jgi:hypothetical protein
VAAASVARAAVGASPAARASAIASSPRATASAQSRFSIRRYDSVASARARAAFATGAPPCAASGKTAFAASAIARRLAASASSLRSDRTSDIASDDSEALCRVTSPPRACSATAASPAATADARSLSSKLCAASSSSSAARSASARRSPCASAARQCATASRRAPRATASRAGRRRPAQDGVGVVGALRVMGERGERHAAGRSRLECGKHARVQLRRAQRRDRRLDRGAREFVAKAEPASFGDQQPARDAGVDGLDRGREDGLDERGVGLRRHDSDHMQHLARRRGQRCRSRHDGVAHGRRHRSVGGAALAIGAGRVAITALVLAQQLGDEERVAAGRRVDARGVVPARRVLGELADRGLRKQWHGEAPHVLGRQFAEHWGQPSQRRGVVAVAEDEERRHLLHAPAQVLDEIERRLVRPVHVLEDHHRRRGRPRELAEHCREQAGASRRMDVGVEPARELAAGLGSDVVQRSERPGRRERFAAAPQHAAAGGARRGGEALEERRLADAGLAADEHRAAARARRVRKRRQGGQQVVAFEQGRHGAKLSPAASAIDRRRHPLPRGVPSGPPLARAGWSSESTSLPSGSQRMAQSTRRAAILAGGSLVGLFAHGITLSARWSSASGIVMPSAFAALRLITSSYCVACSTGISAGFAPFRILSTKPAAFRQCQAFDDR